MPKKTKDIKYYEAVGRRKESVAIARLYIVDKSNFVTVGDLKIKKGEIFVNGKPIENIFTALDERVVYRRPLKLTNSEDRFAISIKVFGGGKTGWLEAISLAIARALVLADKNFKPTLRKNGLLTRDSRIRERRKVGTGGKARRAKQSPKR
jgi:small subunit ribosomal protein S9